LLKNISCHYRRMVTETHIPFNVYGKGQIHELSRAGAHFNMGVASRIDNAVETRTH